MGDSDNGWRNFVRLLFFKSPGRAIGQPFDFNIVDEVLNCRLTKNAENLPSSGASLCAIQVKDPKG